MLKTICRYSAIALAILFVLLCFMPDSTSPMEALTPATYLVLNLAGVCLLTTVISGAALLIHRLTQKPKPGPTSFNS